MTTNNSTNTPQLTTNGQLLIGKTGENPVAGLLTAGTNVNFTFGPGTITINSTNSGGTVTSVSGTAGEISSTGGNTPIIAMVPTTVTPGSYTNLSGTVDAFGRLTAASSGTSPILTITGTALEIDVTAGVNPVISIDAGYLGQTSITTLGTITTGTWSAANIALNHGGTNAALIASNGGIFYSTASAGAILAGTATATQMLQSGSSTTPAWSTTTWPATSTINQLLYSSSANVIGGLTTVNSAVLLTNSSGVPSFSGTMTNGQLIIGNTSGTPTAATLTAGSGVSITNGSGIISISATGSGGTVTSITAGTGLSGGTITSTGTIAIANTAVTAGSYTVMSATVNAQGQITAASSGAVQVQIDFGSSPQLFSEFTITDTLVTTSSILIGMISYSVGTTGKSLDEISMDTYCVICQPGSGQLIARVTGLEGPLANKFMLNYMRG